MKDSQKMLLGFVACAMYCRAGMDEPSGLRSLSRVLGCGRVPVFTPRISWNNMCRSFGSCNAALNASGHDTASAP